MSSAQAAQSNFAHPRPWALGLLMSAFCAATYLMARPPLFDFDGYTYLLSALGPERLDSIDHLHVLWGFIQILLVSLSGTAIHPPTILFQILGIALSSAAMLIFCVLLYHSSDDPWYAASASLFIALSPRFWYLTFQNEPYPKLFLMLVLHLLAWNTSDMRAPTGWRLLLSALCLSTAILVHQAAIFLVPPGTLALIFFANGTWKRRLVRAMIWTAGIALVVLSVYLYTWSVVAPEVRFFSWTIADLTNQHPLELPVAATVFRSMIGAFGSIVQDQDIRAFLDRQLSPSQVFAVYGAAGAALGVAGVWLLRRSEASRIVLRLLRTNGLFMISVLSILFWSSIVVLYEPVTQNYWLVDMFPAAVCFGLLLRERDWKGLPTLATALIAISVLNLWLNHHNDMESSLNAPEHLLASIDQHVCKEDRFIVLANHDWYGDVEYELLFEYLRVSSDPRGIAILNDFLLPASGSSAWRTQLRDKIDSTLDSCHHVFLAQNVLDPSSYKDLAGTKDAFSPFVNKEYVGLDEAELFNEVKNAFEPYVLEDSELDIGADHYLTVRYRGDYGGSRAGCS